MLTRMYTDHLLSFIYVAQTAWFGKLYKPDDVWQQRC